MEKEKVAQILDEMTTKLDELSSTIKTGKEDVEQESKQIAILRERVEYFKKYLEEARKGAVETRIDLENRIKENPLTFLAGAFVGGLIIGRLTKIDIKSKML